MLFVVGWLLLVVRCLWFVVYWLLFVGLCVVGWLLLVDGLRSLLLVVGRWCLLFGCWSWVVGCCFV